MKKIAIVTGSSKGIGLEIVNQLIGADYFVYGADIDESASFTSENFKFVKCDVSSVSDVENLYETVNKDHGVCHVLVNNAAIQYVTPFEDLEFDEWKKVIDVNLHGVFLCTKTIFPLLKASKAGNIVNITSLYNDRARLNKFHYDASKAGVTIFTKEMALALADYNIRVNAVAPGAIDTPMNADSFSNEEVLESVVKRVPLSRIGQSSDVAKAVLFLISDDASYITGDTIKVDGGRGL